MATISTGSARILAGLELNAMVASGALPADIYEGLHIASQGTIFYDYTGEALFIRFPLLCQRDHAGIIDVACNTVFPAVVLSVTHFRTWMENLVRAEAVRAFHRHTGLRRYDSLRFIALGLSRTAALFTRDGREAALIDLATGDLIEPVNPDCWSYKRQLDDRTEPLQQIIDAWGAHYPLDPAAAAQEQFQATVIDILEYSRWINLHEPQHLQRQVTVIPYGYHDIRFRRDLFPVHRWQIPSNFSESRGWCFEMRTREMPLWCVYACTQMILDFYRYIRQQDLIRLTARNLWVEMNGYDLGELDEDPNHPWPESCFNTIPNTIRDLSNNALHTTLYSYHPWEMPLSPEAGIVDMRGEDAASPWSIICQEIETNHPCMCVMWGSCEPSDTENVHCANEGKCFEQTHAIAPVGTRVYCSLSCEEDTPWRYLWIFDPAEIDSACGEEAADNATNEEEEPSEYINVNYLSYDLIESLDICLIAATRTE